MMLAATLLTAALAEDPGDFQVRFEQGAGWMQGAYVGRERATVQGLPATTRVALGSVGRAAGGGVSFGAQLSPWLRVRAQDTFPLQPNATFTADGWLNIYTRPAGPWFVSARIGARLPFLVRGQDERAVVEGFLGGMLALGGGYQIPNGRRDWSWLVRFEVEGHRLGSFGKGQGLDYSPRLDLLVPMVCFGAAYGGER